jgi:hypothetical protein
MEITNSKTKTSWKVGIIPSVICGVGVYILTRWYFNDGCREGAEVTETMFGFANEISEKINEVKGS